MTAAAEIEQAFRKAMRRFAATVSVISARQGVERHAMTATAVTSLSMAPPSLLVPFGTHTIFIGAVTNVVVRDDVAPLIFQDGQYGQCVPLPTAS